MNIVIIECMLREPQQFKHKDWNFCGKSYQNKTFPLKNFAVFSLHGSVCVSVTQYVSVVVSVWVYVSMCVCLCVFVGVSLSVFLCLCLCVCELGLGNISIYL